MKFVVIGLGYVGLSNAILLAKKYEVVGVDLSEARVAMINARQSPLNDPEIIEHFQACSLKLTATTSLHEAISDADYIIVATPTDYNTSTNTFDTSSVEQVVAKSAILAPDALIVIKSTIPLGFIEQLRKSAKSQNIVFSPEFLREGKALYDNLYPSRIIVGEQSSRAEKFAHILQTAALKDNVEILLTGSREAEAIKLFANTFLAMRVTFFNELDSYALATGVNSHYIIKGVCMDPRIGSHYNNPSFGYGGYCLPKDTKQLVTSYSDIPQDLISAVVRANDTRKAFIAQKILDQKPNVVGIYRLVMKTGSENYRERAIMDIIVALKSRNAEIIIYEPTLESEHFLDLKLCSSLNEFKSQADLIVANRNNPELLDVEHKLLTRDIFGTN